MVDSVSPELARPWYLQRAGLAQKARAVVDSPWLPWALIGLGIVLRLIQYLTNRSFWYDEALIAHNILSRDYAGLAQPLDDNQAAPVGFLWITKFFVSLLGNNEYVFRLYPMICGILALVLAYYAGRRYLRPRAVPILLLLFATTPSLIYYSSEVKPYMGDVMATLLVLLVTAYVWDDPLDMKRIVLYQITGFGALFFSFPALFVLAGAGLTLFLTTALRRDWKALAHLMVAFAVWGVGFIITYILTLANVEANEYLVSFWASDLVPFPPANLSQIRWYFDKFFAWFNNEQGVQLTDFAGFLFIVGAVSLFMTKRIYGFVLLLPFGFMLAASALDRYPIGDRLILFMTPLLLLLVAEGAQFILDKTKPVAPALGTITLALLFIYPAFAAAQPTFARQDIKPVMEQVAARRQPGDVIWLYYFTRPAFEYYMDRYGFASGDYLVGTSWVNNRWVDRRGLVRTSMREDLDRLRGFDRVWVFFTNSSIDEQSYNNYLQSVGRLRDRVRNGTANAYLYDLNPANDR